MEDSNNLLDEFSGQTTVEAEIEEYRKASEPIRAAVSLVLLYAIIVYMIVFVRGLIDVNIAGLLGSIIGSFIGLVVMTMLPAAILAIVPAFFIKRKFPYKERYKKVFWFCSLGVSIVIAIAITIALVRGGSM